MAFEDFLRLHNIVIHFLYTSTGTNAFTIPNGDQYIVFLNGNLSYKKMQEAFVHEFLHIEKNHFSYDNVEICEKEVEIHMDEMLSYFKNLFEM